MLGRIYGVASIAQVATLLAIFLMVIVLTPGFDISMLVFGEAVPSSLSSYQIMYVVFGVITCGLALVGYMYFPIFQIGSNQNKSIIIRSRYWLYYALIFMSGARRQIFVVFAGFLMVEKFGYSIGQIAFLFLINAVMNIWLAPLVGRMINNIGERRSLIIEYVGLIGVFTAYAFVSNATIAAALYVIDHMFFALAIAIKTYFQKIADPADFAGTSSVSFTINHIVAVFLPAAFGLIWLYSPPLVFITGAGLAAISLLLAFNVPHHPDQGNEVMIGYKGQVPVAGE